MFHKKSISSIITILAVITFVMGAFPSQVAHAYGSVTYYVAPYGSDIPGYGSEVNPWATIGYALGRVSDGETIQVAAGTYDQDQINMNKSVTLSFANGVVIQGYGGCFWITADNVHLTAASAGGAKCKPLYSGGLLPNGIDVNNGIQNLVIDGLDIDGSFSPTDDGIHFAGAITGLQIVNNHIHRMNGDGIEFASAPQGVYNIQGNLFENNGGYGINSLTGSPFNIQYNSWGSAGGPLFGDWISGFDYTDSYFPWTHVAVAVPDAWGSMGLHLNKIVVGESITYTVRMNAVNVTGVDVKLLYPSETLSVIDASTIGSAFGINTSLDYSTEAGTISFHGMGGSFGEYVPVTNPDALLFTVTFVGTAAGGAPNNLHLDQTSDAFAMDPGSGPSNSIYASSLSDGTVTVMAKATVNGTVSLQGRVNRSGVVVNFSTGFMNGYGPFTATSTNMLSNNLSISDVVEDSYAITTNVPGYLNVTSDLAKTKAVSNGNYSLSSLELKGGDVDGDNYIDILDGSVIGFHYGDVTSSVSFGDINGDGKVDIFDLALMGGNYGLNSAAAYANTTGFNWVP